MPDIHIVVVDSDSVYVEKLNKRLYTEIERPHYYHEVVEMPGGFQRSIHLFTDIRNEDYLAIMLRSYETLERTAIYSGKVMFMKKYYIHGNNGPEGRLKIHTDNKQQYDIPLQALEEMGIA